MKIKIPFEIDLPEKSVEEIKTEAKKEMAEEILSYLEERSRDYDEIETEEAQFTLYGIGIAKKKLERYR